MPRDPGPYDALIVGGGHNGLVCACYLAAAGLNVCVVERRAIVGGAAVTEEFHPGFRNSTASYTVSLLNPKVIRDLNLARHGLTVVERPFANFLPLSDGDFIKVGGGLEATQREVGGSRAATPSACPTTTRASKSSPTCCAACSSKPRPTWAGAWPSSSARGSRASA